MVADHLAGEGGEDLRDRSEGEDQDQHVGPCVEDPAQVLPEERRTAGVALEKAPGEVTTPVATSIS